ncbi:MAG: hypothetical protein RL696_755, partial [Actinomycetota bacterium]
VSDLEDFSVSEVPEGAFGIAHLSHSEPHCFNLSCDSIKVDLVSNTKLIFKDNKDS